MHRHPKLSAWQREEDGSYKSEIDGLTLHVTWRPESKDAPRGFLWKVEGEGKNAEGAAALEEIESAMVEAEDAARRLAI